jgi:hypothetical protein
MPIRSPEGERFITVYAKNFPIRSTIPTIHASSARILELHHCNHYNLVQKNEGNGEYPTSKNEPGVAERFTFFLEGEDDMGIGR